MRLSTSRLSMLSAVVVQQTLSQRKEPKPEGRPPHHFNDQQNLFQNPWESFNGYKFPGGIWGMVQGLFSLAGEWKSKPLPPKSEFVKVAKPDWAADANRDTWAQDIKATWLGHACFLVELPAPKESEESKDLSTPARGPRILFDPVFSHRCSPSQLVGPARHTPPPMPMNEIPYVDVVVLSHDHYDHTDTATLKHIYRSQPKGSVHFLCGLGNQAYFQSIGISNEHVTELDWWDARDVLVGEEAATSRVTITCLPSQHFSGRSLYRFQTLWASWAIEQRPYGASDTPTEDTISKVWFGGDTGLRSVPKGRKQEDMPVCPAFKQIGERFGGFDLAMVPIGAFSPRAAFSPIHASPEDAVEIHLSVRSRRSIGMHWGCWALGDEAFMQDPQRLKDACEARGVSPGEFDTLFIGETLRQAAGKA